MDTEENWLALYIAATYYQDISPEQAMRIITTKRTYYPQAKTITRDLVVQVCNMLSRPTPPCWPKIINLLRISRKTIIAIYLLAKEELQMADTKLITDEKLDRIIENLKIGFPMDLALDARKTDKHIIKAPRRRVMCTTETVEKEFIDARDKQILARKLWNTFDAGQELTVISHKGKVRGNLPKTGKTSSVTVVQRLRDYLVINRNGIKHSISFSDFHTGVIVIKSKHEI